MISVEQFYEEKLKGKSEKEILSVIRLLKKEIGHLKNVMEHPNYIEKTDNSVSEYESICYARQYLERAKLALIEIGVEYTPSKAEIRVADFQDNISFISKITFEIMEDYAYRTYYIDIRENTVRVTTAKQGKIDQNWILEKDRFVKGIENLYIREWRAYYDSQKYGIKSVENNSWWLVIEYNNKNRRVKFCGNNAFPYNLNKFIELLRVDNTTKNCE